MNFDPHFHTGPGYPQSKPEVEALSLAGLHEFMGECDAEPADFENCLSCFAYLVSMHREKPGDAELRRLMFLSGGQVGPEPVSMVEVEVKFYWVKGQYDDMIYGAIQRALSEWERNTLDFGVQPAVLAYGLPIKEKS